MSTPSTEHRIASWPRLALAALLAVALVLRLRVAWAGLYTLILDVTSDDAYYYFQIARNLVDGGGVSFDGETPTNGFHPLWLVLLTPIAAAGGDPVDTLHWGLSLSALFGTATVYWVYASARTLTNNAAAGLATASFTAVHPALVRESVNGLETALSVCLIAWVVHRFLRMASRREPPRTIDYVRLGLASGLMLLARTDSLFVLPPLALFFFARERGRRRLESAVAIAAPALLVLGPWIAWSLASFGTLVQISGVAIAASSLRAGCWRSCCWLPWHRARERAGRWGSSWSRAAASCSVSSTTRRFAGGCASGTSRRSLCSPRSCSGWRWPTGTASCERPASPSAPSPPSTQSSRWGWPSRSVRTWPSAGACIRPTA
jgi:hypothetical protein